MSVGKCLYNVIFIDDFTRFTRLYSRSLKSKVFSTFVKFKTIAENLLSCKIKQIQTDNGGEYISKQSQNFLHQNGLHHRLSCPHTSQQNGISERKHRYIQELGITLLA